LPKSTGADNFASAARTTVHHRVVQFCLRRELPAPGTKGGLFCICVAGAGE
jgi:hypothetical protein